MMTFFKVFFDLELSRLTIIKKRHRIADVLARRCHSLDGTANPGHLAYYRRLEFLGFSAFGEFVSVTMQVKLSIGAKQTNVVL